MTPTRPLLRIFLSSPADVAAERDAAERLIRQLAQELADRVDLRLVRWENLERRADQGTFQAGIDRVAKVEECHLLIGILWTRLGVPLPEDMVRSLPWDRLEPQIGAWGGELPVTGTAYEWLSGLAHIPEVEVKLFRKTTRPPAIEHEDEGQAEDAIRQRRMAKAFWERLVRREDGTFRFAHQSFDATAAFTRDLERELRLWLARHINLPGEADAAVVTWRQGSPWRGLGVFEPEHAPVFCGRDRSREAVLALLRAQTQRRPDGRTFALVVGMSGSGKSSLVRAGVIPHLPGSDPAATGDDAAAIRWRHAIILPGEPAAGGDPVLALIRGLSIQAFPGWKHGMGDDAAFAAAVRSTPQVLAGLVGARLAQEPATRLFLLIDQFEELVSAVPQAALRAVFVRLLDLLASNGVWLVATLRGDYYQAVLEVPGLADLKAGRSFDLLAPSAAEVAEIILHPAQAAGLQFERGPDGRYLNQVIAEEFLAHGTSLPLLSFVLNRLYEADRANSSGKVHAVLEFSEYAGLGRLAGGIATHVRETLAGLDPAVIRRLFPALVRVPPEGDAKPVRRRTPLSELPDEPALRSALDALVTARLVDRDGGEGRSVSISLAHEILILPPSGDQPAAWPELATWTSEQKHLLRSRDRLAAQAAAWQAAGGAASHDGSAESLLLGDGLPILDAGRVVAELVVDQATRDFLAASHQRLQRQRAEIERTRRRRQRAAYLVAAGGVALATIAGGFGYFASIQRQEAQAQSQRANREADAAKAALQQATEARAVATANEKKAVEASHLATQKATEAQLRTELTFSLIRSVLFDLRDQLSGTSQAQALAPLVSKMLDGIRAQDLAEGSLEARRLEVVCEQQLGNLATDPEQRREHHLTALRLTRALVAAAPNEFYYQDDLCVALNALGDDERLLGGLHQAEGRYAESQRLAATLAQTWSDDITALKRLVYSSGGRAQVAAKRGDHALEIAWYRLIEEIYASIAFGRRQPSVIGKPPSETVVRQQAEAIEQVATYRENLSTACIDANQPGEGLRWALRGLEAIAALEPERRATAENQRRWSMLFTDASTAAGNLAVNEPNADAAAALRGRAEEYLRGALNVDRRLARTRGDEMSFDDLRVSSVKLARLLAVQPTRISESEAFFAESVLAARQGFALNPTGAAGGKVISALRANADNAHASGDAAWTTRALDALSAFLAETRRALDEEHWSAQKRPDDAPAGDGTRHTVSPAEWSDLLTQSLSGLHPAGRLTLLAALLRQQVPHPESDENLYAWELLTSTDPALRDPAKAYVIALRAVERSERKDASILDTLALALARAGKWDEAVRTEAEAIALLPDDTPERASYVKNLASFRARNLDAKEAP
jgi:tetratricopeptide (TPR) repeat protein